MQDVIDLILFGFKSCYKILCDFSITAYGFTFSMWDFLCVIFVISVALPLFFAPRSSGGVHELVSAYNSVSERSAKEKSDQKNSKK